MNIYIAQIKGIYLSCFNTVFGELYDKYMFHSYIQTPPKQIIHKILTFKTPLEKI